MGFSSSAPTSTSHDFEVDGIRFRVTPDQQYGEMTLEQAQAYVVSRMARSNGQDLGGKNLTIEFMPSIVEGHDTWISRGLAVGKGVTIHARTNIAESVSLGDGVHVGSGSTIGAYVEVKAHSVIGNDVTLGADVSVGQHATVGSDTKIGEGNHIPDFSTVEKNLSIPDGLLTRENTDVAGTITKEFVARLIAKQPSIDR